MSPDRTRRIAPEVAEQELPGIGRRYDLDHLDGGRITVVIHHSGRRDLYLLPEGDDEPNAVLTLTDHQARALGAILGGAYFKPAVVEEIEAVIGNLLIDWVTLPATSPAVGHTIGDLGIRTHTRMTVVAIVRGGAPAMVAPEPTEALQAGDQLVVAGRREDLAGFLAAVGASGG
jgi:TrkA domain protein